MNIKQAVMLSRAQRCVGGGLLFTGALFYFISLLMAIYRTAQSMNDSALLWRFGAIIQNFIAAIFELTAPYIGFVWRNVPTINQADPFTYGNLFFLGLVGVMIVGKQLVLAGRRLRARIQRQIDRVEDMQWHNSMMASRTPVGTSISANLIGQINILQQTMPPNPDGGWWTRPWGLIGLSIISGYFVAVLAKLTGML
ncbi:YniB family protein [Pseudomonas putida]